MVAIKYIGPGRYGTVEPKKIWTPDEVQDIPREVAEELLKDLHFVAVKDETKPLSEEPKPSRKEPERKPRSGKQKSA